jgi:hypothetical protein
MAKGPLFIKGQNFNQLIESVLNSGGTRYQGNAGIREALAAAVPP